MSALKRNLAQETPAKGARAKKQEKLTTTIPDRHQPSLLLPVSGGRRRKEQPVAEQTTTATRRRGNALTLLTDTIKLTSNIGGLTINLKAISLQLV
jgi:hypothetical protein